MATWATIIHKTRHNPQMVAYRQQQSFVPREGTPVCAAELQNANPEKLPFT